MVKMRFFCLALVLALTGCGGGGGGGGAPAPGTLPIGSQYGARPTPKTITASFQEASTSQRATYNTHAQYTRNHALGMIGADWLYARAQANQGIFGSAAGKGVTVGVIDSGTDSTHEIFAGQIDKRSRFTYDLPAGATASRQPITTNTPPGYRVGSGQGEADVIARYPLWGCGNSGAALNQPHCVRTLRRADGSLGELPLNIAGNCPRAFPTGSIAPPCVQNIGTGLDTDPNLKEYFQKAHLRHGTPIAAIMMGKRLNTPTMLDSSNAQYRVTGAAYNHGVAYEAKLLQYTIRSQFCTDSSFCGVDAFDSGSGSSVLERGVRFHNGKSAVVNISTYAISENPDDVSSGLIDALAQANTKPWERTIYVVAAGNKGDNARKSPYVWGLLPHYFPNQLRGNYKDASARNHMLTVMSVQANGDPAPDTRGCREAKAFCLAAPGYALRLALAMRYYGGSSKAQPTLSSLIGGTSFAAPYVAGSIGALISYFKNQLGRDEIVARVLATANKSGKYANSDIYGQGLLDLKAASAPVHTLSTTTTQSLSGGRALLAQTGMFTSAAYGDALTRALGARRLLSLDGLNAPFPVSLDALLVPTQAYGQFAHTYQDWMSPPVGRVHVDARRGRYFALSVDPPPSSGQPARPAYFLRSELNTTTHLTSSYGVHPAWALQPQEAGAFASAPHMFLPGLLAQSHGMSLGVELGPVHMIAFSAEGEADAAPSILHNLTERTRTQGFLTAMTLHAPTRSQLHFGFLHETGALAGFASRGGLAWGGEGHSWIMGGQSRVPLSGGWQAVLSGYVGVSEHTGARNYLLSSVRPVLTSQFAIGAQRNTIWHPQDSMRVYLAQPVRVERGAARLNLPVARRPDRTLVHDTVDMSLEPSGRELRFGTEYSRPLWRGQLALGATLVHQAGHMRAANLDMQFLLQYRMAF